MDIGISIVVTFVLVLVNGYFSMSEMALVNAKQVLLQHEAEEGDKRAGRALLARRPPVPCRIIARLPHEPCGFSLRAKTPDDA